MRTNWMWLVTLQHANGDVRRQNCWLEALGVIWSARKPINKHQAAKQTLRFAMAVILARAPPDCQKHPAFSPELATLLGEQYFSIRNPGQRPRNRSLPSDATKWDKMGRAASHRRFPSPGAFAINCRQKMSCVDFSGASALSCFQMRVTRCGVQRR